MLDHNPAAEVVWHTWPEGDKDFQFVLLKPLAKVRVSKPCGGCSVLLICLTHWLTGYCAKWGGKIKLPNTGFGLWD